MEIPISSYTLGALISPNPVVVGEEEYEALRYEKERAAELSVEIGFLTDEVRCLRTLMQAKDHQAHLRIRHLHRHIRELNRRIRRLEHSLREREGPGPPALEAAALKAEAPKQRAMSANKRNRTQRQ